MAIFEAIYDLLWGDIIHITLPGGSTLGLSLLVLILVPAGIYFTIRTRFLPFRMFPGDDPGNAGKQPEGRSRGHFRRTGADHLYRMPRRHGQSGRCGGGHIGRRRRSCVLDVGDRPARLIHGVHRSDAGAAV